MAGAAAKGQPAEGGSAAGRLLRAHRPSDHHPDACPSLLWIPEGSWGGEEGVGTGQEGLVCRGQRSLWDWVRAQRGTWLWGQDPLPKGGLSWVLPTPLSDCDVLAVR